MARRKTATRRRVTPAALAKLALALPEVEEGTSYGTPAWRVKKKLFARLREDGDLALWISYDDREAWMRADPKTFHVTDHYRDYPMMLVRLERVHRDDLRTLLTNSWLRRAPKRVREAFEAGD